MLLLPIWTTLKCQELKLKTICQAQFGEDPCPPVSGVARVHVRYDSTLLKMVEGQHPVAEKKVIRIIDHARHYLKRSGGLAMDVNIEIVSGPDQNNNCSAEDPFTYEKLHSKLDNKDNMMSTA